MRVRSILRSAIAFAIAIAAAGLITLPLLAETLSREAQMAINHLRSRLPGILSMCDERLAAAIDEANRAQRGVIVQGQREALVTDERGEYRYASADARNDMVMSAEYLAALWSRRLDLVEQGLCFEALPASSAEWAEGEVGILSFAGTFDHAADRLVQVVRVLGPKRAVVQARIVGGQDQTPAEFVLDGLSTDDWRAGDQVQVGREPFAVVSVEVTIQVGSTTRMPALRPVQLHRFGPAIADVGRDEVERYRRTHPRPQR